MAGWNCYDNYNIIWEGAIHAMNFFVNGVQVATENYVDTAVSSLVTGPSSSTDNAIARFDGTTGKLIQDGANNIIGDQSHFRLLGSAASIDMQERATGPTASDGRGHFWVKNDSPNTPYFTDDGSVDYQIATNSYVDNMTWMTVSTSSEDNISFTSTVTPGTINLGIQIDHNTLDVTSSRAFGTSYQNTRSHPILVDISINTVWSDNYDWINFDFKSDSSATPTTIRKHWGTDQTGNAVVANTIVYESYSVVGKVDPGDYYRIDYTISGAASAGIYKVLEINF